MDESATLSTNMKNTIKVLLVAAVPRNERSGGTSSMLLGLNSGLSRSAKTEVLYVEMPRKTWREKFNGLLRKVGFRTSYEFFSNRRLDSVSEQVEAYLSEEKSKPDVLIFVGITHFIHCNPDIPYLIYQDCSFQSYFETYNQSIANQFKSDSISSLVQREVAFAKRAKTLLFTSEWAEKEAGKQGFSMTNVAVVPSAGEYDFNPIQMRVDRFELLFVSTDFKGKGGYTVLGAFKRLKEQFPEIQLTIIGKHPAINERGISALGFLDKNISSQALTLREVYSRCGLLLLPSKSDVTSILIKELRQYGCPVVCSDWSALPEQIEEGISGFVWPIYTGLNGFVERVSTVLTMSDERYASLREACLSASQKDATYDEIADKIMEHVWS